VRTVQTENKPWFSSWPKNVPKHLKYPKTPLHQILEKTAKEYPEKTALSYSESCITYAQLDSLANQFAGALAALSVEQGDRVAVFLPNIPQFVIAYYGVLKAGAVVTAISPLHKEREVAHQLRDSEAETIVVLDSLHPIVETAWQKTRLKNVIVTSLEEYALKPASASNTAKQKPNVHSFQELLKEAPNPPRLSINPADDLAALQYTGGTTGTSKGAMLTHANLVSNAVAFAAWIRGASEDTFLTALPLFHIYGMTTSMTVPISLAAQMVLLPKFDRTAVLEAIQRNKVTVFCGVPTMYSVLLANPQLGNYDLTSIRVCISGASPLPPQVQKRFMEVTGGFLAEGYGLTEASPVTHCNPVDKTMRTVRVGSIGLPLPDTDARIVDVETGEMLELGETGELAVKGPQVMKGYWRKPGETALVLRDGWLLTGDIARMDSAGFFYITDRKKDLIKYKDYSVYPRELEDVLYEHPAVKLCAVVGKPTPIVGEVPKAFIVLKDGEEATEAELMAFVKEKVAPYKTVREVEFRQQLPISGAGKVLRRTLQEEEKQKQQR
jgi:long-chain acyl-CoA synthetase